MRYCIKFGERYYPIKPSEIEKVIRGMSEKSIVVLTCGVFNGAYIQGIIKDIWAEKGYNYGHKFLGDDGLRLTDFITDLPEKISKSLSIIKK